MNNKRKLLLALTGASAIAVWTKPVVDAVVLPVHAQTSSLWEGELYFDEGFTEKIKSGDSLPVGSTFYYLVTSIPSVPNTIVYGRRYVNGQPAGSAFPLVTEPDGKIYGKIEGAGNGLAQGDDESLVITEDEAEKLAEALVDFVWSLDGQIQFG